MLSVAQITCFELFVPCDNSPHAMLSHLDVLGWIGKQNIQLFDISGTVILFRFVLNLSSCTSSVADEANLAGAISSDG
jgi:hypothetical protein